jgi:hypothetical protein
LTEFKNTVVPVLGEADIQYNMIVTERPGHAQEILQSIQLEVRRKHSQPLMDAMIR